MIDRYSRRVRAKRFSFSFSFLFSRQRSDNREPSSARQVAPAFPSGYGRGKWIQCFPNEFRLKFLAFDFQFRKFRFQIDYLQWWRPIVRNFVGYNGVRFGRRLFRAIRGFLSSIAMIRVVLERGSWEEYTDKGGKLGKGEQSWVVTGCSTGSIEFQTLRDLQTFNIKQINQLCRHIIPLG